MSRSSTCLRHSDATVNFEGLICPLCEANLEIQRLTRQYEQFRDEVQFAEDRTKE